MTQPARHFQTLIIGAGTAGISVAARLCRKYKKRSVGIVDPAAKHYYQPMWTLVGAGVRRKEVTERDQASVLPTGATWIQDSVMSFLPEENAVTTSSGERLTYDHLVVAPGIQIDWQKVEGLAGKVGSNGLCSNYSYETVDSTWECIKSFAGGTAVFTHPNTPIKCGGAPQKIMYLAADYWRKHPPKSKYEIIFCIATPKIFAVPRYAATLLEVVERYGIEVRYQHDLSWVDAENKKAVFKCLESGRDTALSYEMMHVTPPMSAPDFVKSSPLANSAGWVDVDQHTLQHLRFGNVFGIGDASSLPTSKTGAAIRKQAPVLVENLSAMIEERPLPGRYDGYTSCPLVTGYGKLVMAEFDYGGNSAETFPFDQSKERRSMFWVKKHLLPYLYWDGMLKGRA
ncbi:MAG: FAD/NAD(P)-binding oxidoreductase [Planctomycetota bacterium]